MTTVINKYHGNIPEDAVYIGRGSKWGNPFRIGPDGSRDGVIQKYRDYIQARPDLLNSLDELKGKALVCFCKPKPCHGDILAELVKQRFLGGSK